MFTRIMKILMIVLLICIVIIALATGVESESFLYFIGVLVGGVISLAFIGMIVEMANNILDIKKIMQRQFISENTSNNAYNTNPMSYSDNNFNYNDSTNKSYICEKCGTQNSSIAQFCKTCGNSRPI